MSRAERAEKATARLSDANRNKIKELNAKSTAYINQLYSKEKQEELEKELPRLEKNPKHPFTPTKKDPKIRLKIIKDPITKETIKIEGLNDLTDEFAKKSKRSSPQQIRSTIQRFNPQKGKDVAHGIAHTLNPLTGEWQQQEVNFKHVTSPKTTSIINTAIQKKKPSSRPETNELLWIQSRSYLRSYGKHLRYCSQRRRSGYSESFKEGTRRRKGIFEKKKACRGSVE